MPDEEILHQADTEAVIEENVTENFVENLQGASDNAAIADVGAASVGYVQAEATEVRTAVNAILATLRETGIVPVS